MAETPSPEVQAANDAKSIAVAEKDAAEARLAKARAERELAGVDAIKQAELDKAIAEAETAVATKQKAAADAQTAVIGAEQAATKAKFGTVTANSVQPGDVTAGTNAGGTEATILAARSLDKLAELAAARIDTDKTANYVIFPGTQKPSLGNLRLYELKKDLSTDFFQKSKVLSDAADAQWNALPAPVKTTGGGRESFGAAVTGAGAILDSLAKLGSFFQTSYKFENVTVSGIDDDLFAAAVAGRLGGRAYLPGRWPNADGASSIFGDIRLLSSSRLTSAQSSAIATQRIAELGERLKTAKEDETKAKLQLVLDAYTRAAASHQVAQKAFDDFLASLAAVENGQPAIVKVADEKFVSDRLKGGAQPLFLKVHMQGGGSFTKRSIWTFLGSQPFYATGAVVASYTLLDNAGKVKAAGSLERHAGYHSVGDIKSD